MATKKFMVKLYCEGLEPSFELSEKDLGNLKKCWINRKVLTVGSKSSIFTSFDLSKFSCVEVIEVKKDETK